jgi:hypothetical protein
MAAWIANFMIAQVTPIAFNNIGWKYYLVFAVCGFTNALTVWALFPETKVGEPTSMRIYVLKRSSVLQGRKLEEMDDFFKHSSWFVPTQKFTPLSATQRENELRAGESGNNDQNRGVRAYLFGLGDAFGGEDVADSHGHDEKERIDRTEKV